MNNYSQLLDVLGYKFRNLQLVEMAFTHQSYANENKTIGYDRLEFLGDAVIEMVVSDYIYRKMPFSSGELTKLRSNLVSTDNLYKVSIELGLDKLMLKSKALITGSKKNIADLFESLVGAIYLDGGIDSAKNIIEKFVIKDDNNIAYIIKNSIDYKTKFQEYMQAQAIDFEYKVLSSRGMDHAKTFEVGLYVKGELETTAEGGSIHSAESKCAEQYFVKNGIN